MACGLISIMGTAVAASPDQVMASSWNAEYTESGLSTSPWQLEDDTKLQVMSAIAGKQASGFGYGDYDPYEVQSSTSEQHVMPGSGSFNGYGSYDGGYGEGSDGVYSSTSEHRASDGKWGKDHGWDRGRDHGWDHDNDWLSPGAGVSMTYYDWYSPKKTYYSSWYPTYYSKWSIPYHYTWYEPVVYNSLDPWWATNVYGTVTTTYYWSSSWSWGW